MDTIVFLEALHESQEVTRNLRRLLDAAVDELEKHPSTEALQEVLVLSSRHMQAQTDMIRGFAESHLSTKEILDKANKILETQD